MTLSGSQLDLKIDNETQQIKQCNKKISNDISRL